MQIALNTRDMAGSLRFFAEVFGFANAGGQAGYGDVMRIQGLDPSSRFLIWWMVGRQQGVQLEIFHHSVPAQRPQPADWSPADHGWPRFGIGVPDFDGVLAKLAGWDVAPITAPVRRGRGRRVAIRDPFCGTVIEIIEESDDLPAALRERHFDLDPFIVYATASVSDIGKARAYYGETIGLPISENRLHSLEDEALWGLAGARRSSFTAEADGLLVEVVEYSSPRGRPKGDDALISDQGMMNIALRGTDKTLVGAIIDRAHKAGAKPTALVSNGPLIGTYLTARGCEVELLAAPLAFDPAIGLAPGEPLMGQRVMPMTAYES